MAKSAQKPRKTPLRSCIACRTTSDKGRLIRFVRTPANDIVCDPTGRCPGRGAYLCGEQQCFDRVKKGHLLDRALKTKLGEEDYQRLEAEFKSQCATIDMA